MSQVFVKIMSPENLPDDNQQKGYVLVAAEAKSLITFTQEPNPTVTVNGVDYPATGNVYVMSATGKTISTFNPTISKAKKDWLEKHVDQWVEKHFKDKEDKPLVVPYTKESVKIINIGKDYFVSFGGKVIQTKGFKVVRIKEQIPKTPEDSYVISHDYPGNMNLDELLHLANNLPVNHSIELEFDKYVSTKITWIEKLAESEAGIDYSTGDLQCQHRGAMYFGPVIKEDDYCRNNIIAVDSVESYIYLVGTQLMLSVFDFNKVGCRLYANLN